MTTDKYPDLVRKLKEIFQIDKPELDFGVYRILNARRREIEDFLDNRFKARVETALSGGAADAAASALAAARAKVEGVLGPDAIRPDGAIAEPYAATPVGSEYEKARAAAAKAAAGADAESQVYAHLLAFFSRYYEDGDFISQRRYKEGVYAIPYSGEEVKLYWANADQYYTKTGEAFTNYDFPLDGGLRVRLRLVSADTAKDNVKDNDAERRFKLWDPADTPEMNSDDEEKAYAYNYPSDFIEERDGELWIHFQYLKFPKGTKQKDLLDEAEKKIKDRLTPGAASNPKWLPLLAQEDGKTLLRRHLDRYAAKNTSDYFIHKDLGTFLRRELDFYVKNEMMRLDDVDLPGAEERLASQLRTIRTFRSVALDLIAFMAQLEDFQKKLWLKKKFVVQSDWCFTLDIVREHAPELLGTIFANDAQREEWKRLGLPEEDSHTEEQSHREGNDTKGGASSPSEPSPSQGELNLRASVPPCETTDSDARMVDTKFFDEAFKSKLLAAIPDLDARIDGVLVHSENFQALRLMQERYKEQVKCIYIDPPYNTDATKIIYKNGYENSSWMSLIENSLIQATAYLTDTGLLEFAIDDFELRYSECILDHVFGRDNHISNIAIQTNPKGRDQGFVAQAHDYTIVVAKNRKKAITGKFKLGSEELSKKFSKLNKGTLVRELPLKRTGSEKFREDRPYMYFPFVYDDSTGILALIPEEEYNCIYGPDGFDDNYVLQLKQKYEVAGKAFILPIGNRGELLRWRWGYDSCKIGIEEGILFAKKVKKGQWAVYQYDEADEFVTPKSLWIGERYDASSKGTNLLDNIIPNNPFDYPKSLFTVEDNILFASNSDSLILDFFAGSGTTGHAIIDLNRRDWDKEIEANRKYILVEMGEHFDTVLKPRIEKVVYSPEWKDGKPQSSDKGISHCFHYLTLESYEDTLNNLELKTPEGAQASLMGLADQDEYLLRYMLDVEARGSLLSTDDFRHPFDYAMQIAADSSGATTRHKVDLVETFNWLVGLRVGHVERRISRGLVLVEGTLPGGEAALVVWRDVDKVDNAALAETLKAQGYLSKADEKPLKDVGTIFVNGDHALPPVLSGETGETKVRALEDAFLAAMFGEGR